MFGVEVVQSKNNYYDQRPCKLWSERVWLRFKKNWILQLTKNAGFINLRSSLHTHGKYGMWSETIYVIINKNECFTYHQVRHPHITWSEHNIKSKMGFHNVYMSQGLKANEHERCYCDTKATLQVQLGKVSLWSKQLQHKIRYGFSLHEHVSMLKNMDINDVIVWIQRKTQWK